MERIMDGRHLQTLGAIFLICSCAELPTSEEGADVVDGVATFDILPTERENLKARARSGDVDAAYRLALFYGMAGGETGTSSPQNSLEEERWLRLAAVGGHELAKYNLAAKIAKRECSEARQLFSELAKSATDEKLRADARDRLDDDAFCERPQP